ncbi:MAG: glycosyltransferase [Bacteroidetes bacterium 43-16]|nr:MAG: glycosyltransferase [Bacteroidetes bacterium 43-16]
MLISFVVPVFNEEQTIPIFYDAIQQFKEELKTGYTLDIVFVDDGSQDGSFHCLQILGSRDEQVKVVSFSRNFGKEAALFAGLQHATGDLVVPIDVDLQDPIAVVHEMIKKYEEGYEVVLGKRADRSSDSFLKKKSAELFYRFHNKISKPKIEENVGDFRLMSRKVVNELIKLSESQLFMKGLLSWVGFKTAIVEYKRDARSAGQSKFNGWKLWNLALEGITSFSTLPLKIWTYLGFGLSFISFILILKVIIEKVFFGISITGYASIMVSVLLLGGFIMMGIGILGEYIGRIYMEVKQRPKYVVDRKINL